MEQSSGKTEQLGVTPEQLPGKTQDIAASHPASEFTKSEVKATVKQPFAAVEVIIPLPGACAIVFPQ